jgi:hypothetical protein
MKKLALFAVLLVTAMVLFACGSNDATPAEPATIEVVADTSALEASVATLADAVEALDVKVDALGENFAEEPPVTTDETGGGGDDLPCELALITANPTYVLQIAKDKNGDFKENKAGNPIMQKAPNMSNMKEEYVCLDGDPIRADGGKVFRLMYAQQEDVGDHDGWRGLGADWYQCCFIDYDDVSPQ